MFLKPNRSAEARVFADYQDLTLSDFVEAEQSLGLQEVILAYMDKANHEKTLTELAEEVVASHSTNPKGTEAVLAEIGKTQLSLDEKDRIRFEVFVEPREAGIERPMTLMVHSFDNEFHHQAEIHFEVGDSGKIEKITEKGHTESVDEFSLAMGNSEMEFSSVALLNESGRIFDVTNRMYDPDSPDKPFTEREIVFDNGESFTLSQHEPGVVIDVRDHQNNSAFMDGHLSVADVTYNKVRAALRGVDEAEIETPDLGMDEISIDAN